MRPEEPPTRIEVGVPLPLPEPLVYLVPAELRHAVQPGVRVAVAVGRRRLHGVVLGPARRPTEESISLRSIDGVLDAEPVLPADLLALARFTADYYLCPVGEVLAAMVPGGLPPWGRQRIWLTPAGALSTPRSDLERRVVEHLMTLGRTSRGALLSVFAEPELKDLLDQMFSEGRLAAEAGAGTQRTRYERAYDLAPGDVDSHLTACGRSAEGRAVIALLARLGRPATAQELEAGVNCGEGVLRRLARLGLLRTFQQPVRLSLHHHMLRHEATRRVQLNDDQGLAVQAIAEAIASEAFRAFLLAGVTGSGKTEVYLRAAELALAAGRSALILVPEIALVPSLARAARERFGDRLALVHSGLGGSERHQEWERLRAGEATVALGPRSALFAPLARLGLLVVDEEHETSYKQEQDPRYQARDLALLRAREAAAVAVLVSATPSLESRWNVRSGKLVQLTLRERVGEASLPEGVVVDLRVEPPSRLPGGTVISGRLAEELRATIAGGGQAILLRNRRGFAPLLLCRACGEPFGCEACGLPRTFHRRDGLLVCHYCGSSLTAPAHCPRCGEASLEAIGSGTERVEEQVAELLPGVPIAVLDRDEVRRRGSLAAILEEFSRGETRVLIGTQMVAKGHHFPGVGLTAVLAADSYLAFPDFRAVERTYSQLVQLAGRAGRGARPGKVVVQTFHPDHYAIRAALGHDDAGFVTEEMRFRQAFHYPPFTRMIQVLSRDRRREVAQQNLADLASRLEKEAGGERDIRVTGPAPAPFERLRGEWRFQLLLRGSSPARLRQLLRSALPTPVPRGITIDVDPQHLL